MGLNSTTTRTIMWCVALVSGITAFSLIIAFVNKYTLGFQDNRSLHAFLMTFGLVFLNGEALTIYRMVPNRKPATKYTHAAIQAVVFAIAVTGVNAFFQVSGDEPMDSLHAWVGIGALSLFAAQLTFGLVIFLVPGVPEHLKAFYLRVHVVFGVGILLLATTAAVLGMSIFASWSSSGFSQPRLMMNFAAVCSLVFTGSVTYIVSEAAFKAVPTTQ